MKAALLRAKEQLEIGDVETPEPGPGQVRVRVLGCGICGSDLHFYHMDPIFPDLTPGHEMVGEIDALGDDVASVAVGERVAIEPLVSCGSCPQCRSGRDSICREAQLFGIHRAGGFAEYVVVPARRAFRVPGELPIEIAALSEPMAVAVHGARQAEVGAGQRVLVLGAGTIGLLSVLAARAQGAAEVFLAARHDHQAELGAALGATRVLRDPDAEPFAIAGLGVESPFDAIIETVGGRADTLTTAALAVRPGGTISVVGVFMGAIQLEPTSLLLKEATLRWSNCYARPDASGAEADFETAIRLVDEHRTQLADLTTHTAPLDEIQQAFERADDKRSGAVKVTIRT